jgi:predicted SAM-dependent methyltransferase
MSTDATDASPRLLHLGCGICAPPEWTNVDGSLNAWLARHPFLQKCLNRLRPSGAINSTWPTNIVYHNLRKPLPWADCSFDAVYSSHTLEHMHRDEALFVLKESYRVLKPGGLCRTLVPDLEAIVREYLGQLEMKWFDDAEEERLRDDPGRRLCSRLIFRNEGPVKGNWLYRTFQAQRDYHLHKWMYDGPSLVKLMAEAGFVDVQTRGYLQTAIPRLDGVEQPRRIENGNGVAAEGRKPS